MGQALTKEAVREIARLCRLAMGEDEVERARADLSRVLAHMEAMQALDLAGVEPLTHAEGAANRLAPDEPGPTLDPSVVRAMAPQTDGGFIRVPRVLDAPE